MKGNWEEKNKNPLNNNHNVTSSNVHKSLTKKYSHFGTFASSLIASYELRWEKDTNIDRSILFMTVYAFHSKRECIILF